MSEEEKQAYVDVLSNMTPRVVMWYSYFDVIATGTPANQWSYVTGALANSANGPVAGSFLGHL
jgi:hypothetical protein